MKKHVQIQFENLKSIIENNIVTLRGLLDQSDKLSDLIQKIGKESDSSEIKGKLEETKAGISRSIDILIAQTESLFKVYKSLVEEIFG